MTCCVGCGGEIVYVGDLFPNDPGRAWRTTVDNVATFRCPRQGDEINVRFHRPPPMPDPGDFEAISRWLDPASERPRLHR